MNYVERFVLCRDDAGQWSGGGRRYADAAAVAVRLRKRVVLEELRVTRDAVTGRFAKAAEAA